MVSGWSNNVVQLLFSSVNGKVVASELFNALRFLFLAFFRRKSFFVNLVLKAKTVFIYCYHENHQHDSSTNSQKILWAAICLYSPRILTSSDSPCLSFVCCFLVMNNRLDFKQ